MSASREVTDMASASARFTPAHLPPYRVAKHAAVPAGIWQHRFAAVVRTADLVLLVLVVACAMTLGIGEGAEAVRANVACGVVALALLPVSLTLCRVWDERILGTGSEEFKRVYRAVAGSVVILGLAGLAFKIESVRPWVFGVLPLYGVVCLISRRTLRKMLHRRRESNRCMQTVLAVGNHDAVLDLVRRTRRDLHFGWTITAICTPTGAGPGGAAEMEGVPVVGDLDAVGRSVRSVGCDVVAVGPTAGWGPARLHQLAWQLEGTPTEVVVDPGLMEVAGPRLHITPVDGLPLLRLTQPRFSGAGRLVKATIDRLGAAILLLLLAPMLLVIVVCVRRDGGPAFFRQERVGAKGQTFRMVKFRSMVVGAEARLADLEVRNEAAGPMFKMRADPRITRIGAVLRKYSLDELPQLFNVLTGSMSLVGPRPPLPREVAAYTAEAQRRLLVRPGMTGLWQVSGRSDLSWDETVRLDLRYVENWSIALDVMILWKTLGAVCRGGGAY